MSMINLRANLSAILLACLAIRPVQAQKTEPLFFEHKAEIRCAQYDEDDNLLITASVDGIVKLWDPESGRLIRSFGTVTKLSKSFLADFSPDGKLIATINGRGGRVWNTKFGDLVFSLAGFSDTIKSIHFSNNNKWLVATSLDGTAKVWDTHTGKLHHSLNHTYESLGKKEEHNAVTDARFCDKDQSVVTGSGSLLRNSMYLALDSGHSVDNKRFAERYDSNALVWDVKTGKVIHTLAGYPFDVSPDGGRIVSGSINIKGRDARVWDVSTGNLIRSLSVNAGKVTTCQFSMNGKWILTASAEDGRCKLWEASSGKIFLDLKVGTGNISSTARLSFDGNWISTFSPDTIKVWNVASGKLQYSMPADHPLTFSNDSRRMIILSGKRASVYDIVSCKPVTVEKQAVSAGKKKVLKVVR